MDCIQERNRQACPCTYDPCPRKGACCECLRYHREQRELPACCFPAEAERTFDRSFEHFTRLVAARRV